MKCIAVDPPRGTVRARASGARGAHAAAAGVCLIMPKPTVPVPAIFAPGIG